MMEVLLSSWDVASPSDLAVSREGVYWLGCGGERGGQGGIPGSVKDIQGSSQ